MYDVVIYFTNVYKRDEQGRVVVDSDRLDMNILYANTKVADRFMENRKSASPPIIFKSSESPTGIVKLMQQFSDKPIKLDQGCTVPTISNLPKYKTLSILNRVKEEFSPPPFL